MSGNALDTLFPTTWDTAAGVDLHDIPGYWETGSAWEGWALCYRRAGHLNAPDDEFIP